uniref:Uncharacterized protein n=1 Tax=Avena sativa TaxID=4498 RepID=A0ACD5TR82_AVESA
MVGTPPLQAPNSGKSTSASKPPSASQSPSGRPTRVRSPSRGRSRTRRGTGGEIVVREIVREGGGGGGVTYPTLTKTNYNEWAILMRVQLQGAGLWEAVEFDTVQERQERQAFGAILRSVPQEMVPSLAAKDNAKLAWDAIKVMRVGVDRVREARRQKLRKRAVPVCLLAKGADPAWLWHARFGHLHFRALRTLFRKQMTRGLPRIDHIGEYCDGCLLGKKHRVPFPQATSYRAKGALELVHTDLCGPISPPTPGGRNYFLLIVDDHSRYMWIEVLRTKSKAFSFFKKVKAAAETRSGCKLLAFRSDRGGEFNSTEFVSYCTELGIKHFTTAPYTPQQNGVVERRNQTVVEMARCMLKSMDVPADFWGEAVKAAVYVLNRSPTRSLDGVTPYELWHGKRPSVSHLRTFGCHAHVKKLGPGINKLADRSTPGLMMGYEEGAKAYRIYDPVAEKLMVSRDAVFEETRPWNWTPTTKESAPSGVFTVFYTTEPGVTVRDDGNAGVLHSPDRNTPEPASLGGPEPHTPGSATPQVAWATPPTHDDALDTNSGPHRYRRVQNVYDTTTEIPAPIDYDDAYEEDEHAGLCFLAAEEPASVEEALADQAWGKAMQEEMSAIDENQTWALTDLPGTHRAIGLKWVFKVKRDPAGNIVKYKARLVAKGYAQRQGVDFEEVFAPVARLETVRLLLALAAQGGWQVHHMDVKSAFLNGDLVKEVYVQQPPGFIDGKQKNKVYRLRKALYGLRQAPCAWNAKLDTSLQELGFERCPLEHALYRRGDARSFLLVGVYVDDLVITGSNQTDIDQFKQEMQQLFKMSDLVLLSYYLGIEVEQKNGEIKLCQSSYAQKILRIAGMESCNACATPMECRLKLSKHDGAEAVDASHYRSVVGSLRYLVNTRPDIACAVGMVSRYMEAPSKKHWMAVKQILRYVQGTIGYGCCYKADAEGLVLTGYTDSDHAGDIDDRKSTTGVVFLLGRNIVTWSSRKQNIVATSSCEAEYVAAASGACQGVWLSRLLGEMLGKAPTRFTLLVDNQSAIALSKNPVHHDRTKHIDVKFHFTRECIEEGRADIKFVGTNDQLADLLTKALGRTKFVEMRQMLGVIEVKTVKRA